MRHFILAAAVILAAICYSHAPAQTTPAAARATAAIVVPQLGALARSGALRPEVTAVEAGVVIREQSATTTLDIALRNPHGVRTEAELWIPVPSGAVVRSFTFQGSTPEATAKILSREEAGRLYGEITAKLKDPALLEFSAYGLARSTVFPVEAHQGQKVRLTYEEILPVREGRVDYQLVKSESLAYRVPWRVSVRVKTLRPLSTVYSPTHRLDWKREDGATLSVRTTEESALEPGPFRLFALYAQQGVSSTLYTTPDERGSGGYFLLLAGPPAELSRTKNASALRRDVTLVLDCSGSMEGEKLRQVKQAARQVIEGLWENETFNIVIYSDWVQTYSPRPVTRTAASLLTAKAFLESIRSGGGTNIHAALSEAMRLPAAEGAFPVTLFLTDGLPTSGVTSEVAIRAVATGENRHQRRVFTFGVGADVNAPLLDKISADSRGTSTYVLPGESVEMKVAQVFRRLTGPVLAGPVLEAVTASGAPDPGRLVDVLPGRLPDLFEGDQLVVVGRYTQERPLTIRVSGNFLGKPESFTQTFQMDRMSTRNAFVARLWGSRKIGMMVDELRQMGGGAMRQDHRVKELTADIVRLSTQFGIMTEYTAFLATEGSDLTKPDAVLSQATAAFEQRAMQTRSGLGAVNQSLNNNVQMSQATLNNRNTYLTAEMNQASVQSIQQANDLTFFFKQGRWVDSRLYASARRIEPVRRIRIGTGEYQALMSEMAAQGRGALAALRGDAVVLFRGEPVLIESK